MRTNKTERRGEERRGEERRGENAGEEKNKMQDKENKLLRGRTVATEE